MKIIKPDSFDCTTQIRSYDVSLDASIWSAGTYALGDKVIYPDCSGHLYESAVSSNTSTPGTNTDWTDLGVSNYYAMFDTQNATQTKNLNAITFEVDFTAIVNSIGFINISGTTLRIEIYESGGTNIYDETIQLRDYGVSNVWDYYFTSFDYLENYVAFDIPYTSAGYGKFTLTAETGVDAKIGSLVYGEQFEIGDTLMDMSLGIKDFSTIELDTFGNNTIIKRNYLDTIDTNVKVDNVNVQAVKRALTNYRSTPLVWVADENKAYSLTYGIATKFSIQLQHPAYAYCRLTVQGL